jgi:Tol biopolymer transport system component
MKPLFWASALATALVTTLLTGQVYAQDQAQTLQPNANLKADGMPGIAASIADKVAPYTEFRGHSFVDWHPKERQMLVRHREAGANTAQIYRLNSPGGILEKLTDFPDPVSDASFDPVHGNYIVYARDSGGNEATQIFRMDLGSRVSTLLSEPDQRSTSSWTHRGDHLLISSVPLDRTTKVGKRDDLVTTLTLLDPHKPEQKRHLTDLPGGGWEGYSFSPDDQQLAALQYRTPSDSDVYLINVQTGRKEKILPLRNTTQAGFGGVLWSHDKRRLFLTTNQGGEFF